MEDDKKLKQLVKEFGLQSPSDDFTDNVMNKIRDIPEKVEYKPLIGRFGRISILIVLLSVIVISIITSEPSGILSPGKFKLPEWDLSAIKVPDISISSGLVAVLLAVFLLVLGDSLFRKRRLV